MNRNMLIYIFIVSMLVIGLVLYFTMYKNNNVKNNTQSHSSSKPTPTPVPTPTPTPTPIPTPTPAQYKTSTSFGTVSIPKYNPITLTTESTNVACPGGACTAQTAINLIFSPTQNVKLDSLIINSYFTVPAQSYKPSGAVGDQDQVGYNDITNPNSFYFTIRSTINNNVYSLQLAYDSQTPVHSGGIGSAVTFKIINNVVLPAGSYVLDIGTTQPKYFTVFYLQGQGGIKLNGFYP